MPDEKVYIRNVQISGNDRTVDRVVRRELYLTEGNLYNRTDLQDSKDALKRTSYFDEVEIEEYRVGENQVDLLVKVKEASTGSISGGIGYGSSDGLLLNASLSDTNVFGSGMKGVVSVDRSDNELSGQIGLTNPRLFDSEYSLGGTLYANNYDWNNYDEKSYGMNVVLGRKLTRNLSASIGYIIEQSRISGLSDVLKSVGYKDGKSIKSSLIPSITYNSTDDYYLPRTGIIASSSLEFAGVGGDEKFLKSRTNFNWYQGIREWVDYDLIFRLKSSFGKIWDRGYIPINEKLYLGGIRNLRGFESRTVAPKVKVSNGQWYETGMVFVDSATGHAGAANFYGYPLGNKLKPPSRRSSRPRESRHSCRRWNPPRPSCPLRRCSSAIVSSSIPRHLRLLIRTDSYRALKVMICFQS